MPPKARITKDEVIKTAIELIRAGGAEALNARAIAAALCCSTQPIFSNFENMDALSDAVICATYDLYLGFIKREVENGKYPRYKAFGMAYIRFAKEEKKLFKLLFMRDRGDSESTQSADFNASVKIIMEQNGVSQEKAERMHMETWIFVHGIATMLATSFLGLSENMISEMLTDAYQGLRARHVTEE